MQARSLLQGEVLENINNEDQVKYILLPEEREYIFGGSVADDYFTLDICKCKTFNRNLEMWKKEASKKSKDVFIQFEDEYHIVIKVKKSCIQFPKPKSKRELSEDQRQAIADRMRNTRNKGLTKD